MLPAQITIDGCSAADSWVLAADDGVKAKIKNLVATAERRGVGIS